MNFLSSDKWKSLGPVKNSEVQWKHLLWFAPRIPQKMEEQ